MDTLRMLAENTDGRAIVNRNDLAAGMKQIVRDSSAYYLLGYNSTQAPQDGKFHEIKVRVKRPGVQVRARKGYWALSPSDVERANAPAEGGPAAGRQQGARVDRDPSADVVRAHLDRHRPAATTARRKVTFVWEPMPRRRRASKREKPGASR